MGVLGLLPEEADGDADERAVADVAKADDDDGCGWYWLLVMMSAVDGCVWVGESGATGGGGSGM